MTLLHIMRSSMQDRGIAHCHKSQLRPWNAKTKNVAEVLKASKSVMTTVLSFIMNITAALQWASVCGHFIQPCTVTVHCTFDAVHVPRLAVLLVKIQMQLFHLSWGLGRVGLLCSPEGAFLFVGA